MVYSIVTQSGGTISIDSEIGQGTTVMIEFPRDESLAPEERLPATSSVPGGEMNVVVENDAQVRRLARQTLEEAGYRVIQASNSIEELENVQTPMALLVTDARNGRTRPPTSCCAGGPSRSGSSTSRGIPTTISASMPSCLAR